jgi:hypothetical protein
MSSLAKLVFTVGLLISVSSAFAVRAEDFKEDTSGVTLHTPEGWKKAAVGDPVEKLSLEKGVASHSDDYCVIKLGHVVSDETSDAEFKDHMVKDFPKDWKAEKTSKITVGKDKQEALRIPYTFTASGISFRLEVLLFKRGTHFTYFQFVCTEKAYEGMHEELDKIFNDADIAAGDTK